MRAISYEISAQKNKAIDQTDSVPTIRSTTSSSTTTTTVTITTTTTDPTTATEGYESSEMETWTWPVPTAQPGERTLIGTDTRETQVPERSSGLGQVLPVNVVSSIAQIPNRIVSTIRGWTLGIFGP